MLWKLNCRKISNIFIVGFKVVNCKNLDFLKVVNCQSLVNILTCKFECVLTMCDIIKKNLCIPLSTHTSLADNNPHPEHMLLTITRTLYTSCYQYPAHAPLYFNNLLRTYNKQTKQNVRT